MAIYITFFLGGQVICLTAFDETCFFLIKEERQVVKRVTLETIWLRIVCLDC